MSEISTFLHKRLYLPTSFRNKVGALRRKHFSKHPLFTFSLFLTVSEMGNILNKCWHPDKSAWKYFYTRHLTLLLHFNKKNCALHRRIYQKHQRFTTFSLVFTVDDVCNISNKDQPPSNSAKYQYFIHETLYPSFISK